MDTKENHYDINWTVKRRTKKVLGLPVYHVGKKSANAHPLPFQIREEIGQDMLRTVRDRLKEVGIWSGTIEHIQPLVTDRYIGVKLTPRPSHRSKSRTEQSLHYLYYLTVGHKGYNAEGIIKAAKARRFKDQAAASLILHNKLLQLRYWNKKADQNGRYEKKWQYDPHGNGTAVGFKYGYALKATGRTWRLPTKIWIGPNDYAGMTKDVKIPIGYIWDKPHHYGRSIEQIEYLKQNIFGLPRRMKKNMEFSTEKATAMLKKDPRWEKAEKRIGEERKSDQMTTMLVLYWGHYLPAKLPPQTRQERQEMIEKALKDYFEDQMYQHHEYVDANGKKAEQWEKELNHEKQYQVPEDPTDPDNKKMLSWKHDAPLRKRVIYQTIHERNWFFIPAYTPRGDRKNLFYNALTDVFQQWNKKTNAHGDRIFKIFKLNHPHWGLSQRFTVDYRFGKYLLIYIQM